MRRSLVWTMLISLSLVLLPLVASAAPVTFNVLFAGGANNPTGTITFTNVGDLSPVSLSFTRGSRTWTQADFTTGCWGVTWAGGALTGVGAGGPCYIGAGFGTNETLGLAGTTWDVDFGADSGTLSFSAVAEPATALMLASGLVGLARARRRRLH
ncbi:MAG: hypothetical protein JRH01_08530 [Deltaproteobacteria bacterium]|nr:hypothetical protein [Deltaproteobacteria bacterium]